MCAIFGLIDYGKYFTAKQREKILKVLSKEAEVRGTDATGFAYNNGDNISIFKRPLPAHKLKLRLPEEANIILGHTRFATQGSEKNNANNHPFAGNAGNTRFALSHNGVLYNDRLLRIEKNIPKPYIETDSYIMVQLLEEAKKLDLDAISRAAEQVEGSFVFTILDENRNSYFVKGDNPLALYHFEKYGFYIYASTNSILDKALKKLGMNRIPHTEIKLIYGDIIKIDIDGNIEKGEFIPAEDYRFGYGFGSTYSTYWHEQDIENEELHFIREFASCVGADATDIDLLYEFGYTETEIEELLYEPSLFAQAVSEAQSCFEYSW